jgi:hypothetical protein
MPGAMGGKPIVNGKQHLDERFYLNQPGSSPMALAQDMGHVAAEFRILQVLVFKIVVDRAPAVKHGLEPFIGRLLQNDRIVGRHQLLRKRYDFRVVIGQD